MNLLDAFLNDNDINKDELMNALYFDIRESVLKSILERMKADDNFLKAAKNVYRTRTNTEAATKIIQSMYKLEISAYDIEWYDNCFRAFMKKKAVRAIPSKETRQALLLSQHNLCAICNSPITLSSMHVDHVIPWDYVGDELENNYQGLCKNCNLHKSNHIALAVSNVITNRRK